MSRTRNHSYNTLSLIFILVFIFLLQVFSVQQKSNTYDEDYHLRYGKNYFQYDLKRKEGIDDSKMPFSALNALPSFLAGKLEEESRIRNFLETLNTARYMTSLFSLLIALTVFLWAKRLYGNIAGFFSLILYGFSPNILAHSRLVTTDIYATGAVLITMYYFWQFLNSPTLNNAIKSGLVLGISQLAKFSMIFLYPILFVVTVIFFTPTIVESLKKEKWGGFVRIGATGIRYSFLFLILTLLAINIGFLFYESFIPFGEYQFRSVLFQSIQQKLSFLSMFPIPLPSPYLDGLDFVRYREQTALGFGNMYLLGELRADKGFPGYFFVALFFKVPIATQLFFVSAVALFIVQRQHFSFRTNEQFLLIPAILLCLYFNFLNNSHIGIRFILPILPLLFIFCGLLCSLKIKKSGYFFYIIPALLLYLSISVFSYYPHFISYFNEFTNRLEAYKILADSNLDWNQNRKYLSEYLENNPDALYEPEQPTTGTIVVGANALTGVWIYGTNKQEMAERFRWLRENFLPVDHIGYSYLIYKISPKDLEKIKNS